MVIGVWLLLKRLRWFLPGDIIGFRGVLESGPDLNGVVIFVDRLECWIKHAEIVAGAIYDLPRHRHIKSFIGNPIEILINDMVDWDVITRNHEAADRHAKIAG